jgi:peptidoglycan L-alanyl-D-glutamate endopeptidase CwlK
MNRPLIIIGAVTGAFFLYHTLSNAFQDTWDAKTNAIIAKLHPKIRKSVARTINSLYKKGIKVKIISGLRTFSQQNKLYNQGRTTSGSIVTHAKAGQSYHNYGLAIDTMYPKAHADEVVKEFKKNGFEWGGDFKNIDDPAHFQKRFGYTWQQFLSRNKYIPSTNYPVF